jgi:predicted ATPase/DNA-binding SARP family transcriptional activator
MAAEPGLRVTLLGPLRVTRGADARTVAGARLQSLLVRLALGGGRAVEPAVLVDAIWAQEPPADPAHALHALVSRLRRALGSPGDVTQVAGGYRLAVDGSGVDALQFERLAVGGRNHLTAGDPSATLETLGRAVALWGADVGTEPPAVAAVAPAVATRLAHLSVEAVADLADAEVRLGRAESAAARLTALLADRPVHERAAALLMDAFAAQGRQAEALTVYERIRETLADLLGTDPGAALRARHLGLLRSANDQAAPKPAALPGNLPAPAAGFVGRDDDLARIDQLLTAGRLVTVTGPGGAGKTRLAVEAARRRRLDHPDGVWMIDLVSAAEPAEVGTVVIAGIGLRGDAVFQARRRVGGDDLDVLADQIGGRHILLLMDNCEHLIDAVAHLVAALLARCAGLRVLATSREPLAIGGEALVPLGPLPVPDQDTDLDQARGTASVRLFIERAAAVRPGFAADAATMPMVVRVVRSLDGMPLALELAAARLRTLSLPDLAAGLSDRFRLLGTGSRAAVPRHRTLRAVIAWSWDLLDIDARTVAERISVLPGGVTPASAAAVCAGTRVPAAEVPDLLAVLVDRSLLQLEPGTGRYRMLETIRAYGLEQLAGPDARDRAANYFAGLVARQDPLLRGPGQLEALRVLRADYDNVLAALRHRCDTGKADEAVRLALRLSWYWQMLGRNPEAAKWLGEALAVPGGEPSAERASAEAVNLLSRVESGPGTSPAQAAADRTRMRELADRLLAHPELPSPFGVFGPVLLAYLEDETAALAIFGRLAGEADVWAAGLAHLFRAQLHESAGELDAVRADVTAALERFRQAGDRWGQAATLPMRAQLRQYDGDLDGALADLSDAAALSAEFGSLTLADRVDRDLRWADLHLRRGDTPEASRMIAAARRRAARAATPQLRCLVEICDAALWLLTGDVARAAALLEDARRTLLGGIESPSGHLRALAASVRSALCLARDDLTGANEALREAYSAAVETRDRPMLAVVAVQEAALAAASEEHTAAAVLLGAASRLRGTHDRTDPHVRRLTARGQAALGVEEFAGAYGKGWELTVQAAVNQADPVRGPQPRRVR